MKALYLKILELLETIPEIRHVDLQYGQLQEEQPSLAYPAVLVSMSQTSENIDDLYQIHTAQFTLQLVCKMAGETNSLAPAVRREQALAYLDVSEKLYKVLQGYEDETFDAFAQTGAAEQLLRKGLKTVERTFTTSWREDLAE